jgi:hypothetical protein
MESGGLEPPTGWVLDLCRFLDRATGTGIDGAGPA